MARILVQLERVARILSRSERGELRASLAPLWRRRGSLSRARSKRGQANAQGRAGAEVLFRSLRFRLGTATCVNANLKAVTRASATHDKAHGEIRVRAFRPRSRETLFGNSVAARAEMEA